MTFLKDTKDFGDFRMRSDIVFIVNFSPLNPVLPSYRNQSIDLLCKSIEWFLYEGNTGI